LKHEFKMSRNSRYKQAEMCLAAENWSDDLPFMLTHRTCTGKRYCKFYKNLFISFLIFQSLCEGAWKIKNDMNKFWKTNGIYFPGRPRCVDIKSTSYDLFSASTHICAGLNLDFWLILSSCFNRWIFEILTVENENVHASHWFAAVETSPVDTCIDTVTCVVTTTRMILAIIIVCPHLYV